MDDKEIIRLCGERRFEPAFKGIVGAYSERLYWHVRRMVPSHEDADDLVQEIYIKIWAALPSFRGDARLFTWIYRIATNETLNFIRRQKVRAALSFVPWDETMDRKVDEDPYFNGTEAQRLLLKAIRRLPQKQGIVFSMRYFEEIPYEEMSEILHTSVGALKASYHIAYEKVKGELKTEL